MTAGRRRIRRVTHDEVGLQIAPMIDVTLLLLFFFMLSGKLTKSARLKTIQVPVASLASLSETTGERDVINIDEKGDWFAGERRVNTAELASHLKARFKNHPPLKLHVRADASTPAARIKELMNLAADAGATEVAYGVRKR
jgi:biopolymer transport protein ExbD